MGQPRNFVTSQPPTRCWAVSNSDDCTIKVCVLWGQPRMDLIQYSFSYFPGIIHTADQRYANTNDFSRQPPVEDDAQTRFYKRHMRKTEMPHASGATPIYNFDEWNAQHYGKAFARNQISRQKHMRRNCVEIDNQRKTENALFGAAVVLLSFFGIVYLVDRSSHDRVKPK